MTGQNEWRYVVPLKDWVARSHSGSNVWCILPFWVIWLELGERPGITAMGHFPLL
jgi:hypothetical protein